MKRIEKMNDLLTQLADEFYLHIERDPRIMVDDVLRHDIKEIRRAIEQIDESLSDLEMALSPQPEIVGFQSSLGPLLQAGERCFFCHRVLPDGGPYSGCPFCGRSFVD